MRGPRRTSLGGWLSSWSLGLAIPLALVVGSSLGLGCKRRDPKPDPKSLAAVEAEWPPHSAGCRSWDDLDASTLEALPAGAHVEAFDRVWETVGQKHYDPTLACLDWLALREHYGAKVAAAGDDASAAYAAINELLGLLGQSHLHATAPNQEDRGEDRGQARDSGPAVVPIAVRWLPLEPKSDAHAVIVVDEAVDGHASGLPRGAILTSIEGEPVEPIATKIADGVSARNGRSTQAAFHIARAVGAMLSCPVGERKTLGFEHPDGGARELEVACFVPEGERMSLGNLRDLPTKVEWRMIASKAQPAIGYLAFNIWMLPMAPRIKAGVAELREQGMAGLVIDLRGNPGGVGPMSIPVARMLVSKAASLGRLQMREFNQEFKVAANPDAFTGPVAVVIDEGTASTSEIFALGMRDIGRVVIVGASPSAGMALPSMIESLPDGGLIQYVVGDYHSGKGTAAEGEGVVPDVLVDESRVDYLAGRDPVLEAAVEELRKQLQQPQADAD